MAVRKDPDVQKTCRELRGCLHQAFRVRKHLSGLLVSPPHQQDASLTQMDNDVRRIIQHMKGTMHTALRFAAEQERFRKLSLGE